MSTARTREAARRVDQWAAMLGATFTRDGRLWCVRAPKVTRVTAIGGSRAEALSVLLAYMIDVLEHPGDFPGSKRKVRK